jgi:GT2 family glycosyltransferase
MSSSAIDQDDASQTAHAGRPATAAGPDPAPDAITHIALNCETPRASLQIAPGQWRLWLEMPPGHWCEARVNADVMASSLSVDWDVWIFASAATTVDIVLDIGATCRVAVQRDNAGAPAFAAQAWRLLAASPRRWLQTARRWRPSCPILFPTPTRGPKIWSDDAIDPAIVAALFAQGCNPSEAARAAEAFADPAIDVVSFDGAPATPLPPPDPVLLETHDPYAAVRFVRPGLHNIDVRSALKTGRWLHLREPMQTPHTAWPAPPKRARPITTNADPLDVAVIIPTRDRPDLLRACLDGLTRTSPRAQEIVLVDHVTKDAEALSLLENARRAGAIVVRADGPFNFPKLIRLGFEASSASVLCLLNNDVTPIDTDWLAALHVDASRDDIGVVAPMLLFPNRAIQHMGITVNRAIGLRHLCERMLLNHPDPAHLLRARRSVSAVTGACFMTRRSVFDALNGLDEQFPSDFNDVDYCLRCWAQGWKVILNPDIRLTHQESATRASVREDRRVGEDVMLARHADYPPLDPYQSPRMERLPPSFALRRARPG